mmetsp:Transcript_9881/g.44788  ORF Transcript_9881/g.44788 Transcript_9881/m.44788 type:complete len:331 (-) Transcript_9881:1497-2489(-)
MTLSPPSSLRPPRFTSGDADLTGESRSTSSAPTRAIDALVSSVGDGTYVRSASSSAFQLTLGLLPCLLPLWVFLALTLTLAVFAGLFVAGARGWRGDANERATSAAARAAAAAMSPSFGCGKPSLESRMSGRDRNGEAAAPVGSNGVTAGWPSGRGSFANGLCGPIGALNTGLAATTATAAAASAFSLSVDADLFGGFLVGAAGLSDVGPVRTAAAASASFNRARRVSTSPWSSCTCISSAFVPGGLAPTTRGPPSPCALRPNSSASRSLRSVLDLNLRCSCCNARNARSCSPSVASSSSCRRLHRASSAAIFSTCASVGRTALTSAATD